MTPKRKPESPKPTPPQVWDYRDARRFVSDLCEWKQAHERGFSFRKLSRHAGLRSPGYIRMFVDAERNLQADTAEKLATALHLKGQEVAFFVRLVAFTQAGEGNERSLLLGQLVTEAARSGHGILDAQRLAYFTDWYVPVIHAMASLKDFRADPKWIARRMSPPIRPSQARNALRILDELGIVTGSRGGKVLVREPVLETDPALRSIWMREYHRAMIRLSERSLDTIAPQRRLVNGFTVTVPREQLEEVRQWTEEMTKNLFYRIVATQKDRPAAGAEVVQVNVQMIPLTAYKEEDE